MTKPSWFPSNGNWVETVKWGCKKPFHLCVRARVCVCVHVQVCARTHVCPGHQAHGVALMRWAALGRPLLCNQGAQSVCSEGQSQSLTFMGRPCVILSVGSLAGPRRGHHSPGDCHMHRDLLSYPPGLGERGFIYRDEVCASL